MSVPCIKVLPCCYELLQFLQVALPCSRMESHLCREVSQEHEGDSDKLTEELQPGSGLSKVREINTSAIVLQKLKDALR